ncbi:MAG: carbohydrate kinase family protein [Pseudomonadota bacterium]
MILGGSVEKFDWETIEEDKELLRKADAVGIFSWNHIETGTPLAQKVFAEAPGLKFLDTGDPTLKSREKGRELLTHVKPDVWSMNQNEAKYFGSFFKSTNDPKEAADILWENGIKVVLHTRDYSYSPEGALSPAFKVKVKRATGAGDCWNAGYIVSRISGLNPEECLTLANAVAGCWVSGQEITPTNISNILKQRNLW